MNREVNKLCFGKIVARFYSMLDPFMFNRIFSRTQRTLLEKIKIAFFDLEFKYENF